MSACDPGDPRRRRGSAAAAVCSGAAASSVALGHHAASHGTQAVAWDDIGMAVAIITAARRQPSHQPEDIAHFCQSLIVGPGARINTPHLTMEIRRDLDAVSEIPHNALSDARAIRAVHLAMEAASVKA